MAEKSEIVDAIEALAVHCRPPLMSVEDKLRWMRDWCADLAEFPLEAITNATRRWRHSGSTKFPTAGQLLPLVREGAPSERGPAIAAWAPISDAEYQQLSVRDKIRHHQILSHEAYRKAGPMFRNTSGKAGLGKPMGDHLTTGQMPDGWREWTERGKHHAQEAHRLRQYLSGKPLGLAAE